jgi:hypothetical protein
MDYRSISRKSKSPPATLRRANLNCTHRVVAELRFCADENPSARIADCARKKNHHAQSAISYKTPAL